MQSNYDITAQEWRWVLWVGLALVSLTFLPFILLLFSGSVGSEIQFMGALHNHIDGAVYLSKMYQGSEGAWATYFQHSPEAHSPVLVHGLYALLGQVSRLSGVPEIPLFHAARVVASITMYAALYYLAAAIWARVTPRRLFLILVSLWGGLGWVVTPLVGRNSPDLDVPEIFPLYSSLVNVHFPLTFALLALLAAMVIRMFRPGVHESPGLKNGGLNTGLASIMLAFIYIHALIPIGIALALLVGRCVYDDYQMERRRAADAFLGRLANSIKSNGYAIRWVLVIGLPPIPLVIYYGALIEYNSAFSVWVGQFEMLSVSPLLFLAGISLPLLLAIPGLYRAARYFEEDGDRFMLIWLVVIALAIYFPTNIQRRLAVGMMIPLAYFGTRALEDYWFRRIEQRWRNHVLMAVTGFASLSLMLVVFLPVLPVLSGRSEQVTGAFLESDYALTFQWLEDNSGRDDVILAAPNIALWIPAWTGARVVFGHPSETLNHEERGRSVLDWYRDAQGRNCRQLLFDENVRYVVFGPEERDLGQTACLDSLSRIIHAGSVDVFEVQDD